MSYVISVSVEVKFSVSHFDGYNVQASGFAVFYAYYGIAWGTYEG